MLAIGEPEAGLARRLDVAGIWSDIDGVALFVFLTAANKYVISIINVPKNGTIGLRAASLALNPRCDRLLLTPFRLRMSCFPDGGADAE